MRKLLMFHVLLGAVFAQAPIPPTALTLIAAAETTTGKPCDVPFVHSGTWTNGITSYVATTGDDGSFVRGDPSRPAKTILRAITNMLAGDSLSIGPGNYLLSEGVALADNTTIYGAGKSLTKITNGLSGGSLITPGNNFCIRDLNLWGLYPQITFGPFIGCGTSDAVITNVLVQRVGMSNHIDCLFFETQDWLTVQVDSCSLHSFWDVAVSRIFPTTTLVTAPVIQFQNTDIYIQKGAATNELGPIDWGGLDMIGNSNVLMMCNCNVVTEMNQRFAVLMNGARLLLDGCTFTYPATASSFVREDYFGDHSPDNVVEVWGCDIPNELVYVPLGAFGGRGIIRHSTAPAPVELGKVWMMWNGPPLWQSNGITFNIREYQGGSLDQVSWSLIANVNALSINLVGDTSKWRCVTSTNRLTGEESTVGIAPVGAIWSRL